MSPTPLTKKANENIVLCPVTPLSNEHCSIYINLCTMIEDVRAIIASSNSFGSHQQFMSR